MDGVEILYLKITDDENQTPAGENVLSGWTNYQDSTRIRSNLFVAEYLNRHQEEATLLNIMVNWNALPKFWFEVYRSRDTITRQLFTPNTFPSWFDLQENYLKTNVGVVAYKISKDYHCLPKLMDYITQNEQDRKMVEICGPGKIGKPVYSNVVRR